MSGSGYVIPIDPSELATRFASDDEEVEPEADISDEEMQEFFADNDYEGRIAPLLDRIPDREADLIELYFIRKKRQADIAAIFGVTQAAISYRLARGIERVKFLLSIPLVSEEEMRADLPSVFPQAIDVDILVGMWESTCQSAVATKLGLTQGRVRHRFFKAVKTLTKAAEANPQLEPYQKVFSAIASKNFNMLREVRLPQWADRGGDACF